MGTIGVKMLGEGAHPANPFSTILEKLMDLGGFPQVAGVIAVTASLAAIMSAADSLIIAVSQLITMEIIRPYLGNVQDPDVVHEEHDITRYAKFVSFGSVLIATLIGLFWDDGKQEQHLETCRFSWRCHLTLLFVFSVQVLPTLETSNSPCLLRPSLLSLLVFS